MIRRRGFRYEQSINKNQRIVLVIDSYSAIHQVMKRCLGPFFNEVVTVTSIEAAALILKEKHVTHVVCEHHLDMRRYPDKVDTEKWATVWRQEYPTIEKFVVFTCADLELLKPCSAIDAVLEKTVGIDALIEELISKTDLSDAGNADQQIDRLFEQLTGYTQRFAHNEAVATANRLCCFAEQVGKPVIQVAVHSVLGIMYRRLDLLDEALTSFKKTRELVVATRQIGALVDGMLEIQTLLHLAAVYISLSDFKAALPIYKEAATIADRNNHRIMSVIAWYRIALCYEHVKDWGNTLEFGMIALDRAETLSSELLSKDRIADIGRLILRANKRTHKNGGLTDEVQRRMSILLGPSWETTYDNDEIE